MEIAKTIVKEEPGKGIAGNYTAKELYYIAQLTEAAERIERMDEETLKQFREVIKLVKEIPEHRLRKQDPVQKMVMETIIRELTKLKGVTE